MIDPNCKTCDGTGEVGGDYSLTPHHCECRREPKRAKCQVCGAPAVWDLAPADSFGEYCDEHVPRGCSCNVVDFDDESPDAEQHRDEQGRLLPCCEYDFYPEGFPPGDRAEVERYRAESRRSLGI